MAAPAVCAVHCLATPILLVLAPAIAGSWLVEGVLMAIAVGFAAPALRRGYAIHHRGLVVLPALLGAALWGTELVGGIPGIPELLLTLGGSTLVGASLLWNHSLRRRSRSCGCALHS